MRVIMRRGGEESFLVPINNFTECRSVCTYWNKVSIRLLFRKNGDYFFHDIIVWNIYKGYIFEIFESLF